MTGRSAVEVNIESERFTVVVATSLIREVATMSSSV